MSHESSLMFKEFRNLIKRVKHEEQSAVFPHLVEIRIDKIFHEHVPLTYALDHKLGEIFNGRFVILRRPLGSRIHSDRMLAGQPFPKIDVNGDSASLRHFAQHLDAKLAYVAPFSDSRIAEHEKALRTFVGP